MPLVEKFYDIVEPRVHSTENGHVDYKKILAEIWKYSELCMLSYSQASQKFIATSHTVYIVEMGDTNTLY